MLNGLANTKTKDVASRLPKSRVSTEDGITELIKHLDKHFLPNTFARKMEAWGRQKRTEKTEELTWEDYLHRMRKWRQNLESYGVVFPEEMYCIALIESRNLDRNMKVYVEGMARSASTDGKNIESEKMEEMLRYDIKSEEGQEINYTDFTEEQLEQKIDWMRKSSQSGRYHGRGNQRGSRKFNSRGRGRTRNCYVCDKPGHLSYKCPDKQHKPQENFTGHLERNRSAKMDSSNDLDDSVLAVSHNSPKDSTHSSRPNTIDVIIDTGATKSVIGMKYLQEIVSKMGEKQRILITAEPGGKKLEFKFGNGNPTTTIKAIHLPVDILGERKKLKFYVLPGKSPCLMGMQALMKMGMVINLSIKAVKLRGKKLEVRETETGTWRLKFLEPDNKKEMVQEKGN